MCIICLISYNTQVEWDENFPALWAVAFHWSRMLGLRSLLGIWQDLWTKLKIKAWQVGEKRLLTATSGR